MNNIGMSMGMKTLRPCVRAFSCSFGFKREAKSSSCVASIETLGCWRSLRVDEFVVAVTSRLRAYSLDDCYHVAPRSFGDIGACNTQSSGVLSSTLDDDDEQSVYPTCTIEGTVG